ncbi:angiotensin-converting enzyme-like isoform X2 [Plodia interpunctella]|nr:angiotensin-converting enzyme-like isoform X2 [Plodia interpunctella]XP_053621359.1 angiotensin-converting enzyme-like isoform X2 [Plodia interpunctella]XP_053621360.1 angiotensin-converting enzyme-like isoform X2 [Plodia interpunctella]XP_053621362.1 angiotensin-converting enzyme-like isoform X2 [Plodia interpunctella]
MYTKTLLVFLLNCQLYSCYENVEEFFQDVNEKTVYFNRISSEIAWKSSIEPDEPNLTHASAEYQKKRITWQQNACDKLATLNQNLFNSTHKRMTHLLCRGPKFNFKEARYLSSLYNELQSTYSKFKVCLPTEKPISKSNLSEVENLIFSHLENPHRININKDSLNEIVCLDGEDDFDRLMSFSKNEEVLRWVWSTWREMGQSMKTPYGELVAVENTAAGRNGYTNIGEAWRDELEIPNLRAVCHHLYNDIKPLYKLLHGVVRFFLRRRYGEMIPERGYIPAHLVGNLWSQSWDATIELMTPQTIDLNASIKRQNWTVLHMAKRADDFYQSLGLPAMTDIFWRESVFSRETDATRCHGSAADMFKNGDYRLIYCSGTTVQDFYVLHHEMGHIQYYMAYEDQPGLFRQANTALHESIGDAIMYGVMTPQHLHRLGLINDTILFNNGWKTDEPNFDENNRDTSNTVQLNQNNEQTESENDKSKIVANVDIEFDSTDDLFMLKQALNKIPQIPFSLVIDLYRWKYFEGGIRRGDENRVFWEMVEELSGITPPNERGEDYFDVAAKFHVPDNTPHIRYFLSSFLQHQIFESLCKASVFGRRNVTEDIPPTVTLNRCDIYGSRTAGRILSDIMSPGHSQHWREILSSSIGVEEISASSLLRYYSPLQELLERFVKKHRIPIGW